MPEQITDLPRTSAAIKELATELAVPEMQNQKHPTTRYQLDLSEHLSARQVLRDRGCDCNFTSTTCAEFLWDFTAYIPFKGMLLVGNLEHDTDHNKITEDFDKLLYSNAPLKLMMCRIEKKYDHAQSGRDGSTTDSGRTSGACPTELHELLRRRCRCCVLCVGGTQGGKSRDFAYMLQVEGEPNRRDAKGKSFEPTTFG